MSDSGDAHADGLIPSKGAAKSSLDSFAQHTSYTADVTTKESRGRSLGTRDLPPSDAEGEGGETGEVDHSGASKPENDGRHTSPGSATFRSAGDETLSLKEDLSDEISARTSSLDLHSTMTGATDPLNADRKELYDGEEDLAHIGGIFSSARLKNTPESLATHRWKMAYQYVKISSSARLKNTPESLATHRWKMAYQYVKRTNATKRRALSTPIGTGARLDGHALGILSVQSELRKILFDLLYNQKSEYILLGLIISHLFVLILRAENVFLTRFHPTKDSLNTADWALTLIFTIECVCRIMILGFYRGPHAYLRNNFNRLDFVIIADSWWHIIRTYIHGRDNWIRLAVLRIFRALLILRDLRFVEDIFAILDAIKKCLSDLESFMILTVMILSFYALLGVQLFGGSFHSRCGRIFDGQPSYPLRLCFRGNALGGISERFDNCNHYGMGADMCLYGPNPNNGVTHFDNFASAFLIVFQVITFEGWALIMQWGSLTTIIAAEVYFIILVITGGYFLVNIYIAVISSVFLKARQEHRFLFKKYRRDKTLSLSNVVEMANLLKEVILSDDAKFIWSRRLRLKTTRIDIKFSETFTHQGTRLRRTMSRAVDWNESNSYLKRISTFWLTEMNTLENLPPLSPKDPALLRSLSRTLTCNLSYVSRFGHTLSQSILITGQDLSSRINSTCWMIVQSKIFKYGVLFFISLNMAALCSLKSSMTRQHSDNIRNLEIALLVIFGIELLVRYFAGGFLGFVDERMNVIDFLVVVISFGNTGPNRKFLNLTPIRMLRWFYVKRSHRINPSGDEVPILVAILRSVGNLGAVYLFIFLIIFIFSIFSMELWGGEMNFDDGYPRANHDSFGQTILLWFTVVTGESWVNYMWDVMRPGVKNRWVAPFLFVLYFIITSFIGLNLIIATILEETELTDNQKKYIQKREHIKWLQTKHYHHLSSARHSDWIIDAVESAQRGLVDARRRMTSMRVPRISIFPLSRSETPDTVTRQQEQQTDDSLPGTTTQGSNVEGPSTGITISHEVNIPTRRASYSDIVDIPGSTEIDKRSNVKIARRRSISSATPITVQAPMQRRVIQKLDPLLIRSGFKNTKLVEGESRTALQSALLAVVDKKAKVAAIASTKLTEVKATKPSTIAVAAIAEGLAQQGGTKGDSQVSFVLSDFAASPTFVVRALPWWVNDRSLLIFTPNSLIRVWCIHIREHKAYILYEYTYLFLAAWGFFHQLSSGQWRYSSIDDKVNIAYTICLAFDVLLNIIAYGFLFTRESYMSDPFNWIDIPNVYLGAMRAITFHHFKPWKLLWKNVAIAFIAIRPLLVLRHFVGLRSLTANIVRTMPVIGQVFTFIIIVYSIFAVIGIQLYANRFRSCSDSSAEGHDDCVGLFRNEVGIMAIRTWINPPFHFDHFGDAMLALFVGSTFDNWASNLLFRAMDIAHKPELQPQRNISPSHALFFVIFICVGGFFILRMFVGVFIDQFGMISGSKLLTERQKMWRDTNRLIQGLNPKIIPSEPSGSKVRKSCFHLIYNRAFELLVVFVIIINILYMTTRHVTSDNNIPNDMYYDGGKHSAIETMFVSLYALEAGLKLLGTRLPHWWDEKWNVAELCMLIISASCLYPQMTTYRRGVLRRQPDLPGIPSMVLKKYPIRQLLGAIFIFLRIFRIIRYFSDMKIMVTTILITLPSTVDTMALMFIWVLIFMHIGRMVFPLVRDGLCITRLIGPNFDFLRSSFSLMMQIMTLDNWSCLLIDMSIKPPYCKAATMLLPSDCGQPVGGILFMLFAVALTTYILANIFVAQILDTVTFCITSKNALLAPTHVMSFQSLWSQKKFDPKCTGYIGQHKLKEFLIDLGYPLGGRNFNNFIKWYMRIEFEVYHFRKEKGVAFRPLLETVCLYKVGPRGLELSVRIERERQIHSIYQKGAALRIQALVRGFLQRRRNKQGPGSAA